MKIRLAALLLSALLAACAAKTGRYAPEAIVPAETSITGEDLLAHINVLSSDRYEGRAPGTEGERLTVNYLTYQFRKLGLAPGNPDGSYVQNAPLVGITSTRSAELTVNGKRMRMKFPEDYVSVSRRFTSKVKVAGSDVVFVGYGVVAPEYGWDDYKGVDVRGKTIVMLINDPAVPESGDPSKLDDKYFNGKAMTYYGRWTYKYEIASEKGAAAAIIVHETGPAGYPYEVVSGSWGRENFDIDRADGNRDRVAVEGWISNERAHKLFELAGLNFDEMKKAAVRKDFKPVALPAKAGFTVNNTLRRVKSRNVIAKLQGTDPVRKDQYIVYTAHWDHLGRDPKKSGDQIFNGALDNASGTAALLELAQAYTKLPAPPRRSILFLAVTAEEKGLLGSKWYASNPLYPLTRTVANINMDGVNQWGRTSDMVVIGKNQSTLEDVLEDAIRKQDRTLVPDPESEKGFYYRSDHFEFAKVGVPALYAEGGTVFRGRPADYSERKRNEYTSNDYHKVSDEIKPDWDLSGAVEDLRVLLRVGLAVAEDDDYPEWKSGSEFKARRDQMLRSER
jgi:Zn-dependent M28 family amino/carboxypeptidase